MKYIRIISLLIFIASFGYILFEITYNLLILFFILIALGLLFSYVLLEYVKYNDTSVRLDKEVNEISLHHQFFFLNNFKLEQKAQINYLQLQYLFASILVSDIVSVTYFAIEDGDKLWHQVVVASKDSETKTYIEEIAEKAIPDLSKEKYKFYNKD
ncbi:MAG: hypothetical protein QM687_00440 [Ferruginibacter sp.]